ncbi:MAG: hypothetical protein HLUCCA09_01580 [Rhodobacteraceae bacterium HLUCCA09]|nr:MAG: hypothetical protein HLUCCA09_01580 [Rhodobacteraceae bacterium HLUCCA09]
MDETEPTGWTARAIVAAGMAGLAALFAFLFLYGDRQAATGASGAWPFVGEVILFHGAGGLVAGAALAGLFGRRGAAGWPLAALGGMLAALLAGLIGGLLSSVPALLSGVSLVTEAIRVGAATVVTPLAVATVPWLGAVWAAAIAALHLLALAAR